MRFWHKTYILTLLLFLVCLNTGIMALAVYTYQKNVENTEASATAEQHYITRSFENDYNSMLEAGGMSNPSLLMESYGNHYKSKGIYLSFEKDGKNIYSGFNSEYSVGKNVIAQKKIDGVRYIFISSDICNGEYDIVYVKNISELDNEFETLMAVYALTALVVSLFLALCLFLVLKRLSVPLDKLRLTTEKIEKGDFSVRAEEKGKDEFALLARSFNEMLSKINEQMNFLEIDAEKKQMLVENMAHELRTPLTSIHGYGEYLEKAAATEEERILAAKYIVSEASRLKKISDILLDTAYVRENRFEYTEVPLGELVLDTVYRLSNKAAENGVTLNTDITESIVSGDKTLLSMLLYNLTENGIKACKQGGKVKISCADQQLTVEDDGKGMTPEQLTHITEPFYRTDRSRSRSEGGAGLGLALCKQIAEAHNASMRFESEPEKGTKITLVFTS